MKVYVVLLHSSGYDGGGDSLEGIFDTFDKAEDFVLKQIADNEDWKSFDFNRQSIDYWTSKYNNECSSECCSIQEHEVL